METINKFKNTFLQDKLLCYKKYYLFIVIVVGLAPFIFNEAIRLMLVPENISYLNPLYVATVPIITIIYIFNHRFNYLNLYLAVLFSGITIISTFFLDKSFVYLILVVQSFCMPIFFSSIKLDFGDVEYVLDKFLNILNFFVIVLLVLGVIDYLTHSKVQLFLADYVFNGELSQLIHKENEMGIYRYYSFFGHPLTTVKYFLVYYALNLLYNYYFNKSKLNTYVLTFTAFLGFIICGSKSALILGVALVLLSAVVIRKHKFVYYALMVIVALALISTPLFQENILQRFTQGIESGDLSTGRNELIYKLLDDSSEKPPIVLGKGSGYSRIVARNLGGGALNFEYPIIMLPYDFSVLGTLIIYSIIFFIPLARMLRNKTYFAIFTFLLLFVYENGNNGIASISDSLGRFVFVTFIYVNISEYINHKHLNSNKKHLTTSNTSQ